MSIGIGSERSQCAQREEERMVHSRRRSGGGDARKVSDRFFVPAT